MGASSDIEVQDDPTPPVRQHGWLGVARQMVTPNPEPTAASAENTAEVHTNAEDARG